MKKQVSQHRRKFHRKQNSLLEGIVEICQQIKQMVYLLFETNILVMSIRIKSPNYSCFVLYYRGFIINI